MFLLSIHHSKGFVKTYQKKKKKEFEKRPKKPKKNKKNKL